MKLTKTCPKCKWKYDLDYYFNKCPDCKVEFDVKRCKVCKEPKPIDMFHLQNKKGSRDNRCRDCENKRNLKYDKDNPDKHRERTQRHRDRRRKRAGELYDEWVKTTNVPFKLMSESEWLETCSYFNGCAICGEEHIETREFFIRFQDGGRYAPWNMIPMCGKCATYGCVTGNPFIWAEHSLLNDKSRRLTAERKDKILDYFTSQLEKVLGNDK